VSLGLFGIAEIIANLEKGEGIARPGMRIGRLMPSGEDMRRS
jgi:hypothetical protein